MGIDDLGRTLGSGLMSASLSRRAEAVVKVLFNCVLGEEDLVWERGEVNDIDVMDPLGVTWLSVENPSSLERSLGHDELVSREDEDDRWLPFKFKFAPESVVFTTCADSCGWLFPLIDEGAYGSCVETWSADLVTASILAACFATVVSGKDCFACSG